MIRLLAVEDDPPIQHLIQSVAESIGVRCEAVRTIAEAQARIVDDPPDGLILDGMLPDGTGLDFLTTLRDEGLNPRWVVFLSAYFKHFAAFQQLKALGVDVVLHKPITPESLAGELRQLFGDAGGKPAAGRPAGFDQLCADYAARLPTLAKELEGLAAGWSPGEQPPAELVQRVHRLAGSAGSYGRPEISKAAASCERHLKASRGPEAVQRPWRRLLELLRRATTTPGNAASASAGERIAILAERPQAATALAAPFAAAGFAARVDALDDPPSSEEVDAIIVDAPGHDAKALLELLARWRSAAGPPTPVVLLTDDDDLELRVAGSSMAGLTFLSKRLALAEVVSAVKELFALPAEDANVLVVDDDPHIFELAQAALAPLGIEPRWAPEPEAFWEALRERQPSAVLMDLNLPVYSGLELLRVMKADARFAQIPTLMLTASRTERVAQHSAELGVPCLAKPIPPALLRRHLLAALRRGRGPVAEAETGAQLTTPARPAEFEGFVGESPAVREVLRRIGLAAQSDVTVLISGESGTGKEVAARALHARSRRRDGPFVAINCGAIPENLLESELFGHVRGAFTGATADRAGLMEEASGGTIFLDEIEAVTPAFQVKLLRVLQEREVRRVGANATRPVDARIVAATNRQLEELVAVGTIREDFYYRVRVFEIQLPPLRERGGDIPLLVRHLIDELNREQGRAVRDLSAEAAAAIEDYPWPGNVRQLRNAIEHAFVTVSGEVIQVDDLPPELRQPRPEAEASALVTPPPPLAASAALQPSPPASAAAAPPADERQRIIDALRATGGNRTRAAQRLGFSRVTLWKKVRKLGIDVDAILEG